MTLRQSIEELTRFLAILFTSVSVYCVIFPFINHLGFPSEAAFKELTEFHQHSDSNRVNSIFLYASGCLTLGITGLVYSLIIHHSLFKDRLALIIEAFISILAFLAIWNDSAAVHKVFLLTGRIMLSLAGFALTRKFTFSEAVRRGLTFFLEVAFYFIVLTTVIWFSEFHFLRSFTKHLSPLSIGSTALFVVLSFIALEKDKSWHQVLKRALDYFVIAGIFLLTLSNEITYFDFSNIIGTANDITLGKDILVNTVSIYGFFDIYFIALMIKIFPFSDPYTGLAIISSIFNFVGYSVIYIFLRYYTQRPVLSLLGLAVILGVNYYFLPMPLGWFPYVSFLRFGFVWPVFFLLFTGKYQQKGLDWLTAALLALSFFWVAETGAWVILAFLATAVAKFLFCQDRTDRYSLLNIIPKLFIIFLAIGIFVAIRIYIKYHHWPIWTDMVYFQQFYARGAGAGQVRNLYLWPIIFLFHAAIVYICLRFKDSVKHFDGWLYLGFYGILLMLYFISQVIIEKLATVVLPSAVLCFSLIGFCLNRGFEIRIFSHRFPLRYLIHLTVIGICLLMAMFFQHIHGQAGFVRTGLTYFGNFLKNSKVSYLNQIIPLRERKKIQFDVFAIQKYVPENEPLLIISKNDTLYFVESQRKSYFKVPFYPMQFFVTLDLYNAMDEILNGTTRFLFIDNSNFQIYNNSGNPHVDIMKKYLARAFRFRQSLGLLDVYERTPASEGK